MIRAHQYKKKNFSLLFLFIAILFLFSCNQSKSKEGSKIIEDKTHQKLLDADSITSIVIPEDLIKEKGSVMNVSKIVSKTTVVPLETNDSISVGNVEKIYIDDDKIFVFDKMVVEGVFIFNIDGSFHTKLTGKGNGPNELNEYWNVSIDKESNHLIIIDLAGRKVNFYDYSGNFIKSKKMIFVFDEIEVLEMNDEFAFSVSDSYNPGLPNYHQNAALLVGDFNKEFTYSYHSRRYPDQFTYTASRELYKYDHDVYFRPKYTDTIFQINSRHLTAKYVIDWQGNGIPNQVWQKIDDQKFVDLMNNYAILSNFLILKNYLHLSILISKEHVAYEHIIYDFRTGEIIYGTEVSIGESGGENRHELSSFAHIPVERYGENTLVFVESANDVFLASDWYEKNSGLSAIELKKLKNVKRYDNPVLLFHTLK